MYSINLEKTGEKIIYLREKKMLTKKELSYMFGFSDVRTVYHWERGRNLPKVDNLFMLADFLGTTVDELVEINKDEMTS